MPSAFAGARHNNLYTKVYFCFPLQISIVAASAKFSRIVRLRNFGLSQVPVISIVDDDASVREATKGFVRSLGYRATAFESAEEFLGSERVSDTSCLIADVQMPGLNGLELQSRLIAEGHRTPVIFVTAFPEESVRARALEAGACGFLGKPFDEDKLLACLERALTNDREASREQ